jgi:hypothetical protein
LQEQAVKNQMIADHWKKIESVVKQDEKLLLPRKAAKKPK